MTGLQQAHHVRKMHHLYLPLKRKILGRPPAGGGRMTKEKCGLGGDLELDSFSLNWGIPRPGFVQDRPGEGEMFAGSHSASWNK